MRISRPARSIVGLCIHSPGNPCERIGHPEHLLIQLFIDYLKKKRIPKQIVLAYYPIAFLEVFDEKGILVDAYTLKKTKMPLWSPPITLLLKSVEEIDASSTHDFMRGLKIVKRLATEIYAGKYSDIEYQEVPGLITGGIKNILENLFSIATTSGLTGLMLEHDEGYRSTKYVYIRTITSLENLMSLTQQAHSLLFRKYKEWITNITRYYNERFGELELSLEETRKIVDSNIQNFSMKMNNEMKHIEENYHYKIEKLLFRSTQIQRELTEIKKKISDPTYVDKEEFLREELKRLERERKLILHEIEELRREAESEIDLVKRKYYKLITKERNKLQVLVKEKRNIEREMKGKVNRIYMMFKDVEKCIDYIASKLAGFRRIYEDAMIHSPALGESLYYLNIIIASNEKNTWIVPSYDVVIANGSIGIYRIKEVDKIIETVKKDLTKIVRAEKDKVLIYRMNDLVEQKKAKQILHHLLKKYGLNKDIETKIERFIGRLYE